MNELDKIYEISPRKIINDFSKIVIMSDCHRGSKDFDDNFNANKNIYNAALEHYYNAGFTYIELGDGDEMWENKRVKDIIKEHIDTFKIIKKFHDTERLIMIYGNHDREKNKKKTLKKYFYKYNNQNLLNNLMVYESYILTYNNHDIFLIHGHQVDLLNGKFWRLSKFLVRYVWKNLERIGFNDPTSAAKNNKVSKSVEKKLQKWSKEQDKIIIAGHTHRPIYPKLGESLYFNDGSCIHPNGVTAIEIESGYISLVKWDIEEEHGILEIKKELIAGPEAINKFF